MKVKALSKGQYKGTMYLLGDVFDIDDAKDKAPWMADAPDAPKLQPGPAPQPKPAKIKGE